MFSNVFRGVAKYLIGDYVETDGLGASMEGLQLTIHNAEIKRPKVDETLGKAGLQGLTLHSGHVGRLSFQFPLPFQGDEGRLIITLSDVELCVFLGSDLEARDQHLGVPRDGEGVTRASQESEGEVWNVARDLESSWAEFQGVGQAEGAPGATKLREVAAVEESFELAENDEEEERTMNLCSEWLRKLVTTLFAVVENARLRVYYISPRTQRMECFVVHVEQLELSDVGDLAADSLELARSSAEFLRVLGSNVAQRTFSRTKKAVVGRVVLSRLEEADSPEYPILTFPGSTVFPGKAAGPSAAAGEGDLPPGHLESVVTRMAERLGVGTEFLLPLMEAKEPLWDLVGLVQGDVGSDTGENGKEDTVAYITYYRRNQNPHPLFPAASVSVNVGRNIQLNMGEKSVLSLLELYTAVEEHVFTPRDCRGAARPHNT
eukprot:CAMPEP_0119159406 /NCGR_PEP_ID=MMETSP1310-20130426/53745_1 /TAXON_ID=464262 /ORGANISM="Genus nov. species nov., Strain RCC2339" /LENGTH=432 /DNA_ID=CAMNT_0007152035 /DNA_START=140 /DNA_END=1435 /DNA_ORIENTATION=-